MACDATARLYDVDEDSVVFKRFRDSNSYDQGSVTFRAHKGKLIDLNKLHESIWATRLSNRTRSGIVSLEVTTIGEIIETPQAIVISVANSKAKFVLQKHSEEKHAAVFQSVKQWAGKGKVVRLTGRVDKYVGKWPQVLGKPPPNPRRILVTHVEPVAAEKP